MEITSSSRRAGTFVKQPAGFRAFIPEPLPPDPPLKMDAEIIRLLSDADRALGRLDGIAHILPNPDLFVAMYVKQEAVLSSQIEGTQATLDDVLQFEAGTTAGEQPKDVDEVVNYVAAMNYGLLRLQDLPLSLRLIREIHAQLLQGVRGYDKQPGEFRTSQNWLGPREAPLSQAAFVPPPVHHMNEALDSFEKFLHANHELPVLIHCGLAHAQFETIHPFLDGNGRVGRLLISFLLCERSILRWPMLYLSHYLKAHQAQYYDRLMAIRVEGDWEGWLKFFLRGIYEVSQAATQTSRAIVELREGHRQMIGESGIGSGGYQLIDELFRQPFTTIQIATERLGCSYNKAHRLIDRLVDLAILEEVTGRQRNRRFRYTSYLRLFESFRSAPGADAADVQATQSELGPAG
jgi:Fic family protein